MHGLIIDTFAGGGGASLGIAWATGRAPDVAINHDASALAMHAANHPSTRHLHEDIWRANPRAVTKGRKVALLWASPDCKHFSRAKGGKPVKKEIRSLAWVVVRWAAEVVRDCRHFVHHLSPLASLSSYSASETPIFCAAIFRAPATVTAIRTSVVR